MTDLSEIENAKIPNLDDWFSDLAMIHYTIDELKEGGWWKVYKDLL